MLGRLRDRLRIGIERWSVVLDNMPPSDDVVGTAPRSLFSAEGQARLGLGAGGWPVTALFWPRSGSCSARPTLPLPNSTPEVCRVVTPAVTALRQSSRGRTYTGELGSATDDAQGCVSLVTLRGPKRWLRLHCSGPFGAT